MKISVITVCLNSAATIGRTLESFFGQTHPEKELMIVDGASTDDTLKIVQSFPSAGVRIISEPDNGLYEAANKGLAVFSGDAVGLLNSDDRFADEHVLSAISSALADADVVFGNLDFVADHDSSRIVRRWRGTPYAKGAMRRGWMPAHPTFYTRRGVVDAVGFFDVRYRIAADYDFMLRALEVHAFRTAFVDKVLINMKHGGRSTTGPKAYFQHNYEALQSRRRWLGAGLVDQATFAKPARKLGQVASPVFAALRKTAGLTKPTSSPHVPGGTRRSSVD